MTKPTYEGGFDAIEEEFLAMLDRYVRYVFEEILLPKAINGNNISATELLSMIEHYAKMIAPSEEVWPLLILPLPNMTPGSR